MVIMGSNFKVTEYLNYGNSKFKSLNLKKNVLR